MSETAPIEALRAFARTKAFDFDAFLADWLRNHPVIVVKPEPTVEHIAENELFIDAPFESVTEEPVMVKEEAVKPKRSQRVRKKKPKPELVKEPSEE